MILDRVHTVSIVESALAAGIGLDVVVVLAVARSEATDIQQVHGSRAGGWNALWDRLNERPEQCVDDALGGDDIRVADGCWILRTQQRTGPRDDLDGSVGTCIRRQVWIDHALEHVVHARGDRRPATVQRSRGLRVAIGQIGGQGSVTDGYGGSNRQGLRVDAVTFDDVLSTVHAVWYQTDSSAQ